MGHWQVEHFYKNRGLGTLPFHQPRFADTWHDGDWQGQDVWILGGGPSVKKHDLTLLQGRKVIAINMGFTVCEPTIAYFGSVMLLIKLREKDLLSDVPRKACLEAMVCNTKTSFGCHVIEVSEREVEWGTIKRGLPVFSNSGLVCLNLADALGARRVFLLGFDMRGTEDGKSANFHRHYKKFYPEPMQPLATVYDKYIAEFQRIAPRCRAEVLNCTRDSRLEMFPYLPFEKSLQC